MVAIARSQAASASCTSDRCPSCSAPMVGTRPTVRPSARQARTCRRSAATLRAMGSGVSAKLGLVRMVVLMTAIGRMLHQRHTLARHAGALAFQIVRYGVAQPLIGDEMRAPGRGRQVAALDLVRALRARL